MEGSAGISTEGLDYRDPSATQTRTGLGKHNSVTGTGDRWDGIGNQWQSGALSFLSNAYNLLDASTMQQVPDGERTPCWFEFSFCDVCGAWVFLELVERHISQSGDGCMELGLGVLGIIDTFRGK